MNILTALATIATITLCGFIWGFEVAQDNPAPVYAHVSNVCKPNERVKSVEVSRNEYYVTCATAYSEYGVELEK